MMIKENEKPEDVSMRYVNKKRKRSKKQETQEVNVYNVS